MVFDTTKEEKTLFFFSLHVDMLGGPHKTHENDLKGGSALT